MRRVKDAITSKGTNVSSIDSKKAVCTTFIVEFVSLKIGAIATEWDGKIGLMNDENKVFHDGMALFCDVKRFSWRK